MEPQTTIGSEPRMSTRMVLDHDTRTEEPPERLEAVRPVPVSAWYRPRRGSHDSTVMTVRVRYLGIKGDFAHDLPLKTSSKLSWYAGQQSLHPERGVSNLNCW